MPQFSYPARIRRGQDGRYLATFPDFERAATDGKDRSEAIEEAIDMLGGRIANLIAERGEIPVPSAVRRGERLIPVPFWVAGKLALYLEMRMQGVTQTQLARRLGLSETVVRRMLDPDHDTRPEKLQAALSALGRSLVVSVEAA
jgi:antitoxin HicB